MQDLTTLLSNFGFPIVAWSVGTPQAGCTFNNYNTISVELCPARYVDQAKWLDLQAKLFT